MLKRVKIGLRRYHAAYTMVIVGTVTATGKLAQHTIMRTARTIIVYIAYVYNRRREEGPVVVE
jgi:hypothetical protein